MFCYIFILNKINCLILIILEELKMKLVKVALIAIISAFVIGCAHNEVKESAHVTKEHASKHCKGKKCHEKMGKIEHEEVTK